jgi:membrane-associated phospholipid phosphatase
MRYGRLMGKSGPPASLLHATNATQKHSNRAIRGFMKANLVVLALVAATPVTSRAQHVIRWYEVGGTVAGIAALTLIDEPVQRWLQRNRSATTDDVASVFRHGGQPEVYASVPLVILGVGLVTERSDITRIGGRAAAALALAAVTELSLKTVIGRARPFTGLGAHHYRPFRGSYSMPSGHSTLAFALAASLADDARSPVLKTALYLGAAGTAWSRANDDRHWLSDVTAGALIGITAAKLINGRWQVFGLKPPRVLTGERMIISWQLQF